MADMSEFTSVFRARVNLNDKRKANKRNRQALSCLACRNRKLKCDRQHPCTACNKRGEGSSCTFTAAIGSSAVSGSSGISKPSNIPTDAKRSEAQAKLQKLEDLVQQLIQSGAVVSKPSHTPITTNKIPPRSPKAAAQPEEDDDIEEDSQEDSGSETLPPILMCYNEASGGYVGATHWAALLDQIAVVKESLDYTGDADNSDITSHVTISEDSLASDDADLILTSRSGSITIEDAIRALPPRYIADRLLQIYYSVKFSNALFIHTTKFRREYEAFWKNPSSASLIWISVLFSILCMGSMIASRGDKLVALDSYDAQPLNLASKARQCLVAGQHTKCQPYVIEALVIYAYCKYQLNVDGNSTLWALTGYVTRLAQRLGYHRDPKHLGTTFTPFEAEMRRRTWFWVSTFDLVFSFQYGMPGIIHDEQCDTESPKNYSDEDFDEDTLVMPEPRPPTEFTNMLYYCHKINMMSVFRRVIRQALALKQPEYEEILKLDKSLDEIYAAIPPILQIKGTIRDCSFADASYMILHRIVLELTYHKCMCVLHRMYLTFEKDNPKYEYSRKRARTSALRILDLQSDAYDECLPGGRLWDERWMITSLTLHDFLLASMILCLDLSGLALVDAQRCHRCLNALRKSYKIWSEKKHMSRDAYHASNVLGAMLASVANAENENNPHGTEHPSAPTPQKAPAAVASVDPAVSNLPNSNSVFRMNTLGIISNIGGGYGQMHIGNITDPSGSNLGNDMVGSAGGDLQDRTEQPGEFVPRQLTNREEMFGLGLGNDVYPMVESFQPLDFDTLMGDGGNIDWGLVDRFLFDKEPHMETSPSPDANMQIVTPEGSENSSGQAEPPSQTSSTDNYPQNFPFS
ncbi:hypothetical protein H072_643 [Dactylellina haptotyla CBS 200.50]|uniref:Zn(2)-C6 fungal-type domain-containing protein n=1 Tax=Dactylellina haptotyla (strain CBS 200.50) TaxID=1284197 RepID=S8AWT5_DACHA|nr:hypothetical protein H072_643 [Dactylellina haptotyla CBS 200.50]